MKNNFFRFISLLISLLLILLNAGIMTCEAKSDSREMQSKANYKNNFSEGNEEIKLQDEEDLRFRLLVMIVKQNIIKKYNTLEDQEFEDDYLQFICETIE